MTASRGTLWAHQPARQTLVASVAAILLVLLLTPQHAEARKLNAAEFHTVQSGDTWRSIAAFYGTPVEAIWEANGVTNPSLLAAGQRLFIPSPGPSAHSGILLFEINAATPVTASAVKSGNGLSGVLWINGYDSPTLAFGQQLYVPDRQSSVGVAIAENTPVPATAAPAETAIPTDVPTDVPAPPPGPTPTATPGPEGQLNAQLMGVQGHFLIDDKTRKRMLDLVAYGLGFGWVKQQVEWSQYEYAPGQYSQDMLDALDAFMQNANARQLHVLLGIATPPDWALKPPDQGGVDQDAFNNFVKFITQRYSYQIGAIEIWNEPNLGREWGGQVVSAPQYVNLLAGAYQTIKTAYPGGNVVVVSAGLAPTGVNDGVVAIDDRAYFTQMYQAGVQNYADAIGIHPYGWGNPPDSRCCEPVQYVLSHYDHPSFSS